MHRHLASVVVLACSLMACAQDTADQLSGPSHPTSTHSAATESPLPPIRVILQLKNPHAFQSAAFLHNLQAQTQAQVHYIGAVLNDTHVYSFQPPVGQSYAQLLQRLSAMPEVVRVEMDQKIKTN